MDKRERNLLCGIDVDLWRFLCHQRIQSNRSCLQPLREKDRGASKSLLPFVFGIDLCYVLALGVLGIPCRCEEVSCLGFIIELRPSCVVYTWVWWSMPRFEFPQYCVWSVLCFFVTTLWWCGSGDTNAVRWVPRRGRTNVCYLVLAGQKICTVWLPMRTQP